MEAGQRWLLNDVTGQPCRTWDDRGHSSHIEYDQLRRPLRSLVLGADPAHPERELLTERHVYGEQHPDAEKRNLRGKPYLELDQAGVVSIETYDFTGNPVRAIRRLAREYKAAIDWSAIEPAMPASGPVATAALNAALAPLVEVETYSGAARLE